MKISFVAAFVLCSLIVPAGVLGAQEGEETKVTRADLAASYLRFETAHMKSDLEGEALATANKKFDQATLAFFQRKYGQALKAINELTASLTPGLADDEMAANAASLRASIDPPVYVQGDGEAPTIRVESLYAFPKDVKDFTTHIAVQSADGTRVLREHFEVGRASGDALVSVELEPESLKDVKPGRYLVGMMVNDYFISTSTWSVVSASLDAEAAKNLAELEKIDVDDSAMVQALASVKGRNGLLSDSPSPENTAQMLFDLDVLLAEVREEIEALKRGENPFKARKGDYWRVLHTEKKDSPFRVYMPDSAPASNMTLVVAFHGAGGDENMFLDAYGAGIIKELADEHGFLVVSPLTYDFRGNDIGELFDSLLEAIGYDYAYDPKRVFVLGHSMGGGATQAVASARPKSIAAAACICGFGGYAEGAEVPPTFVIAAEFDPLANPARLGPAAQKNIDAGLPVEYRFMKNYGHTLSVGAIMPETIAWLLKH